MHEAGILEHSPELAHVAHVVVLIHAIVLREGHGEGHHEHEAHHANREELNRWSCRIQHDWHICRHVRR